MTLNLVHTGLALAFTFALDYMTEHDFTTVEFVVVVSLLIIVYTIQDIAKKM